MEKTRKFQIVYAGLCQHSTVDLVRGIDLMTKERKQSALLKVRSFNEWGERAGKTTLFHIRGVDFTHFNT